MEISKKADYALRMLAALVRDPSGVVSVRVAAKENAVPYSFARAIQHDLAHAGIVENSRGASGGMRLACDPEKTTLLQLVEAVQGPIVVGGCLDAEGSDGVCPRLAGCPFSPVWCNAERLLKSFYSSVTLTQLVREGLSPSFEGTFALVPEMEARKLAYGPGSRLYERGNADQGAMGNEAAVFEDEGCKQSESAS